MLLIIYLIATYVTTPLLYYHVY